jgi:prophage tail gpP-like protein
MFKPLQYKPIEFYNSENKLIFTGTILNHVFNSNKGRNLVVFSGYSKCGILEDVTIPVKDYPLESNNRSLIDIATRLCGLYGIKVSVSKNISNLVNTDVKVKSGLKEKTDIKSLEAKTKTVFGRTSAGPTETVKDYLAKLCSQKNIILSHNAKGDVVLFQPEYDQLPKFFFDKGNSLEMQLSFNGQALHSEIDIVSQPSDDNQGVSLTDKAVNTLIPVYRPTTKILTSGEETDTKQAAKNELAAELKAINLSIKLQGIIDTIYPGEIINCHNHYIYCYAYNRFMVESIDFEFDEKEDTTTLNCLIPEAFTGGEKIRYILFNHQDEDNHYEPELNELTHLYTNDKSIL